MQVPLSNKLDTWRKDLIDMSKRNPLLYYKSEGPRASGIQFLPYSSALLFSELYSETHKIALEKIPSALELDDLQRRLLRLRARVREDENDRGIRTLYMVFGMLEWHESAFSQDVIRSPLLFVPVKLDYKTATDTFTLRLVEDLECEVNPTLHEKLNHDFKIVLPKFSEIVPEDKSAVPSLDKLLHGIQETLPDDDPDRWKILPEVHLGRFAFQKLVMYQDLQRHTADVLAHPLLQVLGGEASRPEIPSWLPNAEDLDDRIPPKRVLEILDADSSQQEAILLAKADVSFVLKGPPGTGKSQTIANIIAESLGQGKKILFVSEKMAALDVVRKRLQEASLGDFCLDLHSPRTNTGQKAAFLNALKTSLDDAMRPVEAISDAAWDRHSTELQIRRADLNAYVRELHQTHYPLGKSAFDAYAQLAQLVDVPDIDCLIPNIETVTPDRLDAMIRAVDLLSACHDVLDRYNEHPWRETRAQSYSLALESDIRTHYTRLSENLRTLHAALAKLLSLLGENAAVNFSWMPWAVQHAQAVLESPQPLRSWLSHAELARLRSQAAAMVAPSNAYAQQIERFMSLYGRALLSEDLVSVHQILTDQSSWAVSCIQGQVGSAEDTAIALRAEFEKHLEDASKTLTPIGALANTLADRCGLEHPETLGETNNLLQIARHLMQTPNPPSGWLNPSTCAVVRATATDAQEKYAQCAQMRTTLESIYQAGFFTLDLHTLAERFRTQYRSFFRILQASYHRDLKLVRSQLLPGQVRTAAQIEADILLAAKLLDMERALAERRIEYAQTLDRYFDGAETDWEQVAATLGWVTQLHKYMDGTPISAETVALVTGSAKALRPVSVALDSLDDAWTAWEEEQAFCITHLQLSRLLAGIGSFDDVAPEQGHTAIDRLLGDLRTFWQAIDTVERHRHDMRKAHQPVSWAQVCADVELAQHVHDFETHIGEKSESYVNDFGHFFNGIKTDWEAIVAALTWTEGFLNLYKERSIPEPTMALVAYPGDTTRYDELRQALATVQQTMPLVNAELTFSDTVMARTALHQAGKTFDTSSLGAIADQVDALLQQLPALQRWLTCQERLEACRQVGLSDFIKSLLRQQPISQNISGIFQRRFYTLWLDHVRGQSPALRTFRGSEHSSAIIDFRNLDSGHKTLARKRLNAMLRQKRRRVFNGSGEDPSSELSQAIVALRRETNKKRHSAIRVAVQKTAPALLELKPCWMMSPLSVSQFLDSGSQLFDLVIFDEASQVCPEDSISSILRGRQLIVVGDPMQLPPTRFFAKSLADEAGDEDEEDESDERTQSILDECLGAAFEVRSLQWHYRSADEALIAFSNHHFYGDRLVTFPSASADQGQGIRFEYVKNSNYRRGRNSNEAARVADIVFDYLRTHDDRSLGIVALSAAQQDTISDVLDSRMKRDPELSIYKDVLLSGDDPHGIFIKNLESVQGDERDTIILSIGYGPENGSIHKRFGPVNNAGGERRLNVAVTRARKQMIVVSSMRAEDLPPDMASRGSRILRSYLAYADACSQRGAQEGRLLLDEQAATSSTDEAAAPSAPRFDSPFEEAVYNALTARGLLLDTQVGCSGYRIDLAVRDPEHPGSYLLGIECDGASYHSSKTARDRDRLRQAQLEHMGWKLHRIWSSDWFANSDAETRRVLDGVADAMHARRLAGGPTTSSTKEAHASVGVPSSDKTESRVPPVMSPAPSTSTEASSGRVADEATRRGFEERQQQAKDAARGAPVASSSQPEGSESSARLKPVSAANRRPAGATSTSPVSIYACEDCTYFTPRAPGEFRCGRNGEIKEAAQNGHTPACTAWRPAK